MTHPMSDALRKSVWADQHGCPPPNQDYIMGIAAELDRLQGVIDQHDLCHDLDGTVKAPHFAAGCAQKQREVYGYAPDADLLEAMSRVLSVYRIEFRLPEETPLVNAVKRLIMEKTPEAIANLNAILDEIDQNQLKRHLGRASKVVACRDEYADIFSATFDHCPDECPRCGEHRSKEPTDRIVEFRCGSMASYIDPQTGWRFNCLCVKNAESSSADGAS